MHEASRGPRPLILKCERRAWKRQSQYIPFVSTERVQRESILTTTSRYSLWQRIIGATAKVWRTVMWVFNPTPKVRQREYVFTDATATPWRDL